MKTASLYKVPLYEVKKIRDLRDMLQQSVALFGDHPAFMIKKKPGAPYTTVSMKQFAADVDALGTALLKRVPHGSRVAILAETRYEWYVSYLGVTNGTGVVVPLDKELPAREIANLLNRAEADVLIYSAAKQQLVGEIREEVPGVKIFICMDPLPDGKGTLYFWDLLAEGRRLLAEGDRTFLDAPVDPEAMTILLFTSGTTAEAKAVMLCQRNICANLEGMTSMIYIGPEDTFLSVLPLHHTYECTCGFLCQIYRGSTIAVCEGLRYILANIKESRPTVMLVVPAMLEMFHRAIMKKAKADKKMARKFEFARKLSKLLLRVGIDIRRRLFAPVHETFGGRLRMFICGGAPVDPNILQDMQDLGFTCIQGYGLTECAPILAVNRDCYFNNRAAGLPLPGVEIKIIDPDENGIGEIVGRGPNIMLGYYKNPEATAEAIDEEGFFHTGDLGYIDQKGFCYITGRKKNVIVAKNGKNIYPEEIEYLLSLSPYVAESLVSGEESQRDDVVVTATIYPDMEAVKERLGAEPTREAIQALLEEEVQKVNRQLVSYMKIRRVIYRDTEFEKTTSRKIRRQ
ncbi:MAG TPA: AMP-binding protein, partial [Bacillota bacterium]|nr:AMP-binding protein [Bacillota bacterium]